MADALITVVGYLGWAVLLLVVLFGLLGVAAFLGPKRYDPELDECVSKKVDRLPAAGEGNGNADGDALARRDGTANRR